MDDHIQLIKAHYSFNTSCNVTKQAMSSETRAHLQQELQNSGYSSSSPTISTFLSTADVHCTINSQGCTIHIVSPRKCLPPTLLLVRVARRIQCLIKIYGITKHLTFWLIPALNLRYFPREKNALVSPEHINGGFTYAQANTIYVFRREEFPKVMLHETLHHAHIDTHSAWNKNDLQRLYSYFQVDTKGCDANMQCAVTDMRPNEAWIETWAELYHIAILHVEYGLPWKMMWNAERDWACRQAARVLTHQQKQHDRKWRETTHAFSYMVLRAALLWCASKLPPRMNTHDLTTHIISCYEDPNFQKCVRGHMKSPPSHSRFRMTVFGDL